MILEKIVVRLNLTLTFGLAALIEAAFVACAFVVGPDRNETVVTLSSQFLGFAVGSAIGTAISPYDDREGQRFATYWKAAAIFVSGYAASKLDGAVSAALSADAIQHLTALATFRIFGFIAIVLLTAKVTFACRSYHSPEALGLPTEKSQRVE